MCGRGGGQGKDDCRPRVVGEGQEWLKGDNGGESHRGECGSEGWRPEDDSETIPFQISHRDLLALLLPKMMMVMLKVMKAVALVACMPTRYR